MVFFIFWFSIPVFAEINTDPRTKDLKVKVRFIAVASEKMVIGKGITRLDLIDMAQEMRSKYGESMSFDDMQYIADELTKYMRKKGFKFHYAYIKPQTPRNGMVTIYLAEVTLSDINIINKSYVSSRYLSSLFEENMNKVLYQPDIDDVILALKDTHAINVFPFYSRGGEPNSVRLNIRVEDKGRTSTLYRIDNYGSKSSGHIRNSLLFNWNGPRKKLDELRMGLVHASGEASNQYGYLEYLSPIFNLNHVLLFYASNSALEIGGEYEDLGLQGDASSVIFSYRNIFKRTKKSNHAITLGYADKENDFTTRFDSDFVTLDETSTHSFAQWQFNYLGTSSRHRVYAKYLAGEFALGGDEGKVRKFDTFDFNYSYTKSFGDVGSPFDIQLSVRVQQSDKKVPSFERVSLTGASAVRSIEAGQFSADSGQTLSVQMNTPYLFRKTFSKYGLAIRPSIFWDYATGVQYNEENKEVDNGMFAGVGAGLKLFFKKSMAVDVALNHNINAENDNGAAFDTNSFLASLSYRW